MAGQSSLSSSLTIFIIMYLFLAHVSNFYPQQNKNNDLQALVVAKDINEVKSKVYQTKSRSRSSPKMTTASKLVCIIRLLNIALAANAILLANDIQLNPGPGPSFQPELKGLRFFNINICSQRNKMDELRLFCDEYKPHVLSINETWLNESFSDEEVWLPGYNLIRRDRDGHGGGLAVYIAEHLSFNRLDNTEMLSTNFEAIWFELSQPKSKKLLIGSIYKPPSTDTSNFNMNLEETLNNLTNSGVETILMGDFNIDFSKTTPATTKSFQRITKSFSLKQLITGFTRITEHSRTLIDLFFTSRPELYSSGVIPIGFSDHSAIYGIRKLHRTKRPPPKFIKARNYKHYDPASFRDELTHVPWEVIELEETPDGRWNAFKDLFLTVADKHAPVIERRVRGYSVPWLTRDLKNLMQERDLEHTKSISTNRELHWSNYKRLRNAVNTEMRKEKCKYYSNKLSESQEPKEMWRTLNKIVPKMIKTVSPSCVGLTASSFNHFFISIANTLCSHFRNSTLPRVLTPRVNDGFVLQEVCPSFVQKELLKMKSTKATGIDGISARLLKDAAYEISKPITHLINMTISTSVIPSEWKTAKVTPIYKSGKKSDLNNYRPISVLPLISKIMERAVQIQLVAFFTENNVLSIHQSGFRKKHSTETAAVHFIDHILEQMDKQMMTGTVFIDLKKAFDLVDHECLLHKLEHYGIRGQSLNWFENYLTTRSQKVKFGKDLSSSLPIDHGVPQGSILGPILFVLYINDLPQSLLKSSISMYADDTVIYFSGSSPSIINQVLQDDLNCVEKWLDNNRLILNQSKTKWMMFGTRQKLQYSLDYDIQFNEKNIERVLNYCYLGVTLDEHLLWKEHIELLCKKASKRLGLLSRIRPCLTLKAAKCVYNCLIHPIFNYTGTVWGELSVGCSKNLQRLQNRAARITIRRDTTEEAFQILGWVNLETHRKIHKCILVYKCINNLVPKYLCSYFTKNRDIHQYNTRQRNNLHLPKIKLSLGKRTFRFSGSVLFNSLPADVKKSTSLTSFKKNVKEYFLSTTR